MHQLLLTLTLVAPLPLGTESLTTLGNHQHNSLASFKPREVTSLITLITAIFLSAAVNSTLKSDFSSAAPSAGAQELPLSPTGAAAETLNLSSISLINSEISNILAVSK